MLVVIQKIRSRIVRYIKIGPTIVVVISPRRAEAIVMMRIVHASLLRNFLESPVALVVKEQIRFAGHSPRTALHQDPLETAESRVVAELRQVVDIDVHVARDKEIDVSVAVIIG